MTCSSIVIKGNTFYITLLINSTLTSVIVLFCSLLVHTYGALGSQRLYQQLTAVVLVLHQPMKSVRITQEYVTMSATKLPCTLSLIHI